MVEEADRQEPEHERTRVAPEPEVLVKHVEQRDQRKSRPAIHEPGRTVLYSEGFQMKWRETLCLVLVAAASVSATGAQPVESDQQMLIKLERDWNDAFYRKDVAFIESLLAPEFTATYDDGSRGDKAKELALTKEFDQQVESAVQDDFTVKVFGNTAVVWFTLKLVGIKQGQRSGARLELHRCLDPARRPMAVRVDAEHETQSESKTTEDTGVLTEGPSGWFNDATILCQTAFHLEPGSGDRQPASALLRGADGDVQVAFGV